MKTGEKLYCYTFFFTRATLRDKAWRSHDAMIISLSKRGLCRKALTPFTHDIYSERLTRIL